jgi:hypothetical protein
MATRRSASIATPKAGTRDRVPPRRYGLMPIADSTDSAWIMRGVEIVLFMDSHAYTVATVFRGDALKVAFCIRNAFFRVK